MPLNKAQLMETPGGPGVVGAVKVGNGLLIAGDGTISVNPATQVTQLIAGSNITLNPSAGFGAVTITATAQGGVTQINAGTGITVTGNTGNVTVSVNANEVVTGIAAGSNITVTSNVGNITVGLSANPSVSSLLASTTVKANDVSIGLYTPNQGTKVIWNADSGTGATFFDNDRGGGAGGFRFREITAGGVVVQSLLSLSSNEGLIVRSPTDQFAIQLRPSGDIGVGPAGALQFGAFGQTLTSHGAGNPAAWESLIPTQTGNPGKFLSTNGTTTLWAVPAQGAQNILTYTTPGTFNFTIPNGVTRIYIQVIGGGGGSWQAGRSYGGYGGGGGGAGSATTGALTVTPGQSSQIVVGGGGTSYNDATIYSGQLSGPGGTSSAFGLIATGGGGITSTDNIGAGGAGAGGLDNRTGTNGGAAGGDEDPTPGLCSYDPQYIGSGYGKGGYNINNQIPINGVGGAVVIAY